MLEKMKRLVVEEEGQALAEYGLIIALVAVLLVVALTAFKDDLVALFKKIGDQLNPPAAG